MPVVQKLLVPIHLKFSQKVQKYTAIVSVKYQSDQNRITVLRIKRSEKLTKILAP